MRSSRVVSGRATGIGQVEIVPRGADVSAIVGSCEWRPKNESRLE